MNHSLYIHAVETLGPFTEYSPEETACWRGNFPGNAARRMTPLGLMLGEVTKDLLQPVEEALVYATSYSESSTLEKYLASFPTPSPLFFQTCIHPGGIEQVLVQKQCRVGLLLPLAGDHTLVAQAVRSAVCLKKSSVLLCVGEEVSTWLGELAAASNTAFACALRLGTDASGAIGRLHWKSQSGEGEPADTASFFAAVKARENRRFVWKDAGSVQLEWT